jgi:hypothetical protein
VADVTLRRYCCLVPLAGDDQLVSTIYTPDPPATLEHCGRTFHRSNRRTAGGWIIYRERNP